MGRLSQELAATEEVATPLQVQLDRLGKRLGAIALTLVGLLSFLQFLRGADLVHIVLDAIALAVAAMPEGLPVVVTVTLALGMHKMARQHAIVKRLASVETLGCTTVICSDKTGTLTLNQMTARTFVYGGQRFEVSGEGYRTQGDDHAVDGPTPSTSISRRCWCRWWPATTAASTTARRSATRWRRRCWCSPQRVASLRDAVERTLPRVAELPFDSAHKFMATFHRDGDQVQVFVKGAPDVLLARCTRWHVAGVEAAARRDAQAPDRCGISARSPSAVCAAC